MPRARRPSGKAKDDKEVRLSSLRPPLLEDAGQYIRQRGTTTSQSLLGEVFGVGSHPPENYVRRPDVDDEFADAIQRGRHIVIHGSSKQGKTCLRKHYFQRESEPISITCMPGWNLADLQKQILKQAGSPVSQTMTVTSTNKNTEHQKISAKIKTPFAEISGELGDDDERGNQGATTVQYPDFDANDPNDIIRIFSTENNNRIIVLEDFHYLNRDTQRVFSLALKAYHDSGKIQAIIVGVWHDRDRLIQFNGDLTGRLTSIDVDHWSTDSLHQVIKEGEKVLNIRFNTEFINELVQKSRSSVWIVQEVCYLACQKSGVIAGIQDREILDVGRELSVTNEIVRLIEPMNTRYANLISSFCAEVNGQSDIKKWILALVLTADTDALAEGLPRHDIVEFLSDHSAVLPKTSAISRILNGIESSQLNRQIIPIVLDYDQSRQLLHVADRSFLLWLDFCRSSLAEVLRAARFSDEILQEILDNESGGGRHRAK